VEQAKVQVVKEVPVVDLRHNPRLKPTFLTIIDTIASF